MTDGPEAANCALAGQRCLLKACKREYAAGVVREGRAK